MEAAVNFIDLKVAIVSMHFPPVVFLATVNLRKATWSAAIEFVAV
jgi:hypothetical protein